MALSYWPAMALSLPHERWQYLAMEPIRWVEMDAGRSLPLPFPLEGFRMDLFVRKKRWQKSFLQLYHKILRVASLFKKTAHWFYFLKKQDGIPQFYDYSTESVK